MSKEWPVKCLLCGNIEMRADVPPVYWFEDARGNAMPVGGVCESHRDWPNGPDPDPGRYLPPRIGIAWPKKTGSEE